MQISLEELQKVARAHCAQQTGTAPLEPVPAPFVACEEADKQLAREIARTLAQTPDTREARVQEASQEVVPAQAVAVAIMRRVIADRMSQE
ncbi:MAG: hypothetical protein NZM28_05685 [Fimbriimonadales bacterium]|nr:hypothetical protein [Fimbriimonadales bacterium]